VAAEPGEAFAHRPGQPQGSRAGARVAGDHHHVVHRDLPY
jgi:hypothetical protein